MANDPSNNHPHNDPSNASLWDRLKKQNNKPKKYFDALADKYLKAAHILYITLAIFFLVTLVFNSKILTYNNFTYLIKDLNSAASIASENYNSISYTNDELRVVSDFRGGIITASSTDIAIYNASGRKTLYLSENFVSPQIAASKKYAIIYDLGGNNYSVYSSFARVHHGKLSHPISLVTVADNGWFAIVSRDNDHTSVVYLYDDDFNLKNKYSFASKYVFGVSINKRGNRIAILTTEPSSNGDRFSTSVMLCKPGENDKISDVNLDNGIPYGISFVDSGNLQILTANALHVINETNGKYESSYHFNSSTISKFDINQFGCAVAFSSNDGVINNNVLIFDKNGELVYNTTEASGILDIRLYNDHAFINQSSTITKINIKSGARTQKNIFEKAFDIIVYNDSNILLCCQTKAKYVKI
jgi:hypothetical protein